MILNAVRRLDGAAVLAVIADGASVLEDQGL
jgi:hypothetical protein